MENFLMDLKNVSISVRGKKYTFNHKDKVSFKIHSDPYR